MNDVKSPQTISILFDSDKMYTHWGRCHSNVDIINKNSDTKAKPECFPDMFYAKEIFCF